MAIRVYLKHKDNNKIKVGVVGFSWTTFFFGIWVSLFRKDMKIFLPFFFIDLVLYKIMPYVHYTSDVLDNFLELIPSGIFLISFYLILLIVNYLIVYILGAFCYNRIYTQALINKGFYPISLEDETVLKAYNFNLPNYDNITKDIGE